MTNEEFDAKYKTGNKKDLNDEFLDACFDKNLELIKHLLTNKKYKNNIDINTQNSRAIRLLCNNGNTVDILDYLLTSEDLKKNLSVTYNISYIFKYANTEILSYLIFEYKLVEDNSVKDLIKDKSNIRNMFELRNLNDKLNDELLAVKIPNVKSNKI